MRNARILAAIRPKVPQPPVKKQPAFRIGPWGFAFLLGGLALASWMAKPSKAMPMAAMDHFKPRIAIVFVLGDSKGEAEKFAQENGYEYIDAKNSPQQAMEPLVQQGHTKFIVDHVPINHLAEFEQDVVECDFALDYEDVAPEYLKKTNRVQSMKTTTVLDALKERNLLYLVTGTSSGIGLAITNYLLSQGVEVVGVSRRSTPIDHPHFHLTQGDVSDNPLHQKISSIFAEKLEAVVFNAGILDAVQKLDDSDVDGWRKVFDVNLFSIVGLLSCLIPTLRANNGRAIFVSSDAATIAFQAWGAYSASQTALNHLSMTLAKEEPRIVAVAVAPGIVATPMQQNIRETHTTSGHMDEKEAEFFHELHQEKKLVTAEQSGRLYGNLAIKANKELSGKCFCHNDEALEPYN